MVLIGLDQTSQMASCLADRAFAQSTQPMPVVLGGQMIGVPFAGWQQTPIQQPHG
jgi:hypothetical protein